MTPVVEFYCMNTFTQRCRSGCTGAHVHKYTNHVIRQPSFPLGAKLSLACCSEKLDFLILLCCLFTLSEKSLPVVYNYSIDKNVFIWPTSGILWPYYGLI